MRLVLVSVSFFLPSFFSFPFLFFFFSFFFGGWGIGGGEGEGSYPESSLGYSLHSVHAPPAAPGYPAGEAGACVCSRVIDIFFTLRRCATHHMLTHS